MREERAADAAAAKQAATAARVQSKPRPAAKPAAGPNNVRGGSAKQQAKLEQQIEQAEAALRAVEDELAEASAWATPARSAESTAKHEAAKRAVDELYAQYEQVGRLGRKGGRANVEPAAQAWRPRTSIVAPCADAIAWAIESPSPTPSTVPVRSPRANGSNSVGSVSGSSCGPELLTVSSAVPSR